MGLHPIPLDPSNRRHPQDRYGGRPGTPQRQRSSRTSQNAYPLVLRWHRRSYIGQDVTLEPDTSVSWVSNYRCLVLLRTVYIWAHGYCDKKSQSAITAATTPATTIKHPTLAKQPTMVNGRRTNFRARPMGHVISLNSFFSL